MTEQIWQQALDLALQGKGFCAPNPAVGAVVVKDHQVIATGYHQGPGTAHAERDALNQLTPEESQGASLYVTLEPCCHQGRTPPCTDLIIKHQLANVFYAFQDPNPIVAGKGAHQLNEAGIQCKHTPIQAIDLFYQSYHYWWQTKLPLVTAKIALSADNCIAGDNGEPVAITGNEANTFTHLRRRYSDAILSTAKTVIADDPQLSARIDGQTFKKPVYLIDRTLRFPLDAKLSTTAESITLFHDAALATEKTKAFTQQGIRCLGVPCNKGQLDLTEVIKLIGDDGIHDLWVEAGAECFTHLVKAQLAQRIYLYQSRKLLGSNAYPADIHLDLFSDYERQPISHLGEDLFLSWELLPNIEH